MNLSLDMMKIVVRKMILVARILKCACILFFIGCGQSTKDLPEQAVAVYGDPLEFAPTPIRVNIVEFFEALNKKDYEKVYEFSSQEYQNTISERFFKESFNPRWSFISAEILSITQYRKTFYLVLKISSIDGIANEKSYGVMFWRVEGDAIRFKNMPLGPSDVRGFGEIPDFFLQ